MKLILTLASVWMASFGFSQQYTFQPDWTQGTTKKVTTEQVEREYEDGKLISDTTAYNEANIEVIEENSEFYLLEIVYENQALRAATNFYENLGEDLKDYQDLKLVYAVNKQTGETELHNWEEVQQFMNHSYEQITALLEEKAPDEAAVVNLILLPIQQVFSSKENVEAYMEDEIGYLVIPFQNDFTLGETITVTETGENPFNPMQEISVTTLITLESVDEDAQTCTITQEIQLDLTEFIEMMKSMMQNMSESFGASDSVTAEKTKEMDAFEMNIENEQRITFDYASTWVTQVVNTGVVTGTDPKNGVKHRKEVITTVRIQ